MDIIPSIAPSRLDLGPYVPHSLCHCPTPFPFASLIQRRQNKKRVHAGVVGGKQFIFSHWVQVPASICVVILASTCTESKASALELRTWQDRNIFGCCCCCHPLKGSTCRHSQSNIAVETQMARPSLSRNCTCFP